jgi:hypothetical protein
MDRRRFGQLLLGDPKRGVGHAERLGDAGGDRLVQATAAGCLHHPAQPVGVDPVDELRARVGDHRGVEDHARAREHVGSVGGLLPGPDARAPEPVAQATGVSDQLLDGHPGRGWPQDRLAALHALEHLHPGEIRAVLLHRRVDVELCLLHQPQGGDRGDHLGHRHDPKARVGADGFAVVRRPPARGALVEDPSRSAAIATTLGTAPDSTACSRTPSIAECADELIGLLLSRIRFLPRRDDINPAWARPTGIWCWPR